jgi:hypothetical protein
VGGHVLLDFSLECLEGDMVDEAEIISSMRIFLWDASKIWKSVSAGRVSSLVVSSSIISIPPR